MLSTVFSLTRLRRKSFLYGIFFLGVVAIYTVIALKVWSGDASISPDTNINSWKKVLFEQRIIPGYFIENSTAHFNYFPQTWKPEYKGQANLHVFEDWCGSSTAQLRKNLHYPLYPHTRTTVQKLAVAPQWTNYGLRIFGYLHPYVDGEFVFALSSHDNSEFWLSTDYSPHNLRLLAWIGMSGAEWAAPGEYGKYSSQTSKPIRLSAEKRYFFEVIHKQDNKGTDHVEVAWKLQHQGLGFMTIESEHISLYVNESALLMGDVTHIPQTVASHEQTLVRDHNAAVDMLIEDPRDTFYQVPLMDSKFLHGLLPDCLYRPSYTIKGSHLQRYHGLTFVHFSFIYPNDYTRLTHMESENSCFYPESPAQRETFGFSKYMKLDHFQKESAGRDLKFHKKDYENNKFDNEVRKGEKQAMQNHVDNALFPDYGDDEDDYAHNRRRKLFSYHETDNTIDPYDTRLHVDKFQRMQGNNAIIQLQPDKPDKPLPLEHLLQQNQREARNQIKQEGRRPIRKQNVKSVKTGNTIPRGRNLIKAKDQSGVPLELLMLKHSQIQRSGKMNKTEIQRLKDTKPQLLERDTTLTQRSAKRQRIITREVDGQPTADKPFTSPKRAINHLSVGSYQRDMDSRADITEKKIEMNMPLRQDFENSVNKDNKISRDKKNSDWWVINGQEDQAGWDDKVYNRAENIRIVKRNFIWGAGEDSEDIQANAPVFNSDVNWGQTFQVNPLDLQAQRSDAIDLECKISGNLVLPSSDALPIVKAFMDKLKEKHQGLFTLERVINVVKRVDKDKGNRYLLELELKDMNGKLLRLSHFIYTMIHQSKQPSGNLESQQPKPELVLCNPIGFQWNPAATVHFIVPVKNQARWVKQLIVDMEKLYRETGDNNFNLIITDYSSTDMNVKKALQESLLPSYQYVKLIGNFQRSAGLQAGIDLIEDQHSIVFLCDLHIRFPSSIIDTIRKSCVEGHMVFAPVVMRLDCGATILDARGFWEVHGFGLIGIYKSDLDVVGGMNTKEYKDHWGGEDWELLDRILEAGLEVERIYLRNFFHHFHSKRGMWEQQKQS